MAQHQHQQQKSEKKHSIFPHRPFATVLVVLFLQTSVPGLHLLQGSFALHSAGASDKKAPEVGEYGLPKHRSTSLSFASFLEIHGRNYGEVGSPEYERRKEIFEKRRAEAARQNENPDRSWTAGVTKHSDWTDAELRQLRGWKGLGVRKSGGTPSLSFLASSAQHGKVDQGSLGMQNGTSILASLPESKSWKHLKAMQRISDQGSCGSCWAISSANLMAAYSEIAGETNPNHYYSVQELLACVANPRNCGGQGGCEGATMDLALDYAAGRGELSSETGWRYRPSAVNREVSHCATRDVFPSAATSGITSAGSSSSGESQLQVKKNSVIQGKAKNLQRWATMRRARSSSHQHGNHHATATDGGAGEGQQLSLAFGSYRVLPRNAYTALLEAVYRSGPVGASVAAGPWHSYSHGILDACDGESEGATVDHAVVLTGYGAEKGRKYWSLMNSWGQDWGEDGYIRLLRRDDDDERCADDTQPELGTACMPYPKKEKVCGMCGILYDSVVINL